MPVLIAPDVDRLLPDSRHNPAVTTYALQRILEHLGEDVQSPKIKDYDSLKKYNDDTDAYLANFQGRAAARVLIKRLLRLSEGYVQMMWQARKDGFGQ